MHLSCFVIKVIESIEVDFAKGSRILRVEMALQVGKLGFVA